MAFFAAQNVNVLTWPPLSPDLSPIENMWGIVKRRVVEKQPQTAAELERVAKREWRRANADRHLLDSLFGSMENRLREVLRLGGGKTKY